MSQGIIQTALTNKLRLELVYREPYFFREIGEHFERPTEIESGLAYAERQPSDEFACLLSAV